MAGIRSPRLAFGSIFDAHEPGIKLELEMRAGEQRMDLLVWGDGPRHRRRNMVRSPSNRVEGERRRITALFADVVGSTALAESMDPEDWANVMNRVFDVLARSVERYEGTITQFGGDAIVAVFGAPRAHEDDPWRAVQAGLEMVTGIERLESDSGQRVQIRVGINTGLAVAGAIGSGSHSEYTALGDPMNVAARLESAAEPGSVLVGEETYRLIGSDIEARDVGLLDLKGKSEPIRAYEVVGSRRAPTRTRGIPGLHSPLVGRQEELAALEGLVTIAAAGRGRVAVVLGEPGIGKSRLLRELRARCSQTDGLGWVVGRCLSYGSQMPYHLLTSLIGSLLDAADTEDPELVAQAVEERGRELIGGEAPALKDLAEITGTIEGSDEGDPAKRESYRAALSTLIRTRASNHNPLVIVCEDIHWSDPSSAELLADLIPACHDAPVLLVLTSRLDRTSAGWDIVQSARQNLGEALTEISLGPLGGDDARVLVAHLLAIDALPDELRRLVLEKAEGNPFFVEEVVRMLIEREAIEQRDERWTATQAMASIEVPNTVEALIASRVDRLPDDARRTAREAAVVGRRFPLSLVEEIEGQDETKDTVHARLGVLETHGLIRLSATQPQLEYTFRHALVHEVVYASLLRSERRRLHSRVGEALERRHADRPAEIAETLGHHFDEAEDPRAVGYLMVAGRRALARFANREAFSYFERALDRLESDDEDSLRIRVEAALGQDRAGLTFVPYRRHISILEEALPVADSLGDAGLLARLHLGLVRSRLEAGESYETSPPLRASLEAAFELAESLDDPELRARPAAHMGDVRFYHGDFEGAVELWLEAVPALERAGNLALAANYAAMTSRGYSTMGRFHEAEQWLETATDLAERSGDPNAALDAQIFAGWLEADRGNLAKAQEFTRRAVDSADELGNLACSLLANLLAGSQQLRMGEAESAVAHLERGGEMAAYCQVGSDLLALGQAWLADARTRLGTPRMEEFDEALEAARQVHNPLNEGLILRHRATARLLLPEPDWEAALNDFETAIGIFEKTGARSHLAPALRDYGAALELAGMVEESEDMLRRAGRLFEAMGING
jgi:class 3 adenylate cyclase/tetratricopeptide (TPR) repeat protein